jgi:hypothetical protein
MMSWQKALMSSGFWMTSCEKSMTVVMAEPADEAAADH